MRGELDSDFDEVCGLKNMLIDSINVQGGGGTCYFRNISFPDKVVHFPVWLENFVFQNRN